VRGGARATGAGATLAGLARSNMLLVPLDRQGVWYRYHHLFRDMPLAELERVTGAELRLLPMLSTHLSFAEIAAEMFLSRNTVSSQAMSVYRKLAVGSRSQAVERSRELGLLEG